MIPKVRMELQGARELETALRELPTAALKKATIQRAFRKAGAPIIAAANALLPPAAQRIGITVEMRPSLSRRQKRARVSSKMAVEMFLGVGPSRLSHLFEFGTAPRYTTGKGKKRKVVGARRGQMRATPYLRPAWDGGNAKMLDEFARILWQEIAATAKRYARRQARLLAKNGVRV